MQDSEDDDFSQEAYRTMSELVRDVIANRISTDLRPGIIRLMVELRIRWINKDRNQSEIENLPPKFVAGIRVDLDPDDRGPE